MTQIECARKKSSMSDMGQHGSTGGYPRISQNDISNRETILIMGNLWSALISQLAPYFQTTPPCFDTRVAKAARLRFRMAMAATRCVATKKTRWRWALRISWCYRQLKPTTTTYNHHVQGRVRQNTAAFLRFMFNLCFNNLSGMCGGDVLPKTRDKQVAGLSPTCLLEFFEQ